MKEMRELLLIRHNRLNNVNANDLFNDWQSASCLARGYATAQLTTTAPICRVYCTASLQLMHCESIGWIVHRVCDRKW